MITIVTLLGDWPLTHEWVPACVDSWANIQEVSWPVLVFSDSPNDLDQSKLDALHSAVPLVAVRNQEAVVLSVLEKYPALREMRGLDLTWRKIIDTSILTRIKSGRVLLIDTDVFVRRRVALPRLSGICYLREDIPAYRARPDLPLFEKIVKSFNAGFVLFDPSQIDFSWLDNLAGRYFLSQRDYWWTEQACWSVIAAASGSSYFFDGGSACVLSGFRTRSPIQVQSNKVLLFSSKDPADASFLLMQSAKTPVIHMSGLSKRFWRQLSEVWLAEASSLSTVTLKVVADREVNVLWRIAIALRLFLVSLKTRCKSVV